MKLTKQTTVREFMQQFGTELIRDQVYTNAWCNALFSDYKPIGHISKIEDRPKVPIANIPCYPNWVISDTRFANEAKAIKDRGGLVIRINRASTELPVDILTGKKLMDFPRHSSETGLDDHPFDYIIDNSGSLEDLLEQVRTMLLHFKIIT